MLGLACEGGDQGQVDMSDEVVAPAFVAGVQLLPDDKNKVSRRAAGVKVSFACSNMQRIATHVSALVHNNSHVAAVARVLLGTQGQAA